MDKFTRQRVQRRKSTAFSFDTLSEFTQEYYQRALRQDMKKFWVWRATKGAKHRTKPTDAQFRFWWIAEGPTRFFSTEDTLRYKAELLELVLRQDEGLEATGAEAESAEG